MYRGFTLGRSPANMLHLNPSTSITLLGQEPLFWHPRSAPDRPASRTDPAADRIAELAVAVGSRTGGNLLAVGTQGILHLPEQPSYSVAADGNPDRKSTRLNSSHLGISNAVF